jgi:hypothetical protein
MWFGVDDGVNWASSARNSICQSNFDRKLSLYLYIILIIADEHP